MMLSLNKVTNAHAKADITMLRYLVTYLVTVLSLSLVPVVHSKNSSSPYSNTSFPRATPFEDFCKSNNLGDDSYLSSSGPCNFTFYSGISFKPDHFSCDGIEDDNIVKIMSFKVLMWPESCVAAGPRCYLLADHPDLSDYTDVFDGSIYNTKRVDVSFPADATVVSVDCSGDFAQAQLLLKNPVISGAPDPWNVHTEQLKNLAFKVVNCVVIFSVSVILVIFFAIIFYEAVRRRINFFLWLLGCSNSMLLPSSCAIIRDIWSLLKLLVHQEPQAPAKTKIYEFVPILEPHV